MSNTNTEAVRCLQARDTLLAAFRTHTERLQRISNGGIYDERDIAVCRMAALFVLGELHLPDGVAALERAAAGQGENHD